MLQVRWFFALLVVSSILFLSQMAWAEECPDQNTQEVLQRLSEVSPQGEQVGPVVTGGLKGGGDLIWWFQGIENVVCVSKFVDVDGDALPDVLMESYDSGAPVADHFFCIKGNSPGYGTVLWSCRPVGGASSGGGYGDQCVSYIEDINGDGHVDALLGTAWGGRTAYAINGMTGATIWSYDTYVHTPSGWIYSICPITDLTGDGIDDVIFAAGSDADAAYCVNGTNGNLIWKFQANDAVMSICQIEDMNSDGYADAVIAGGDNEHRLICLSGHSTGTPSIIWQFTFPSGFQDVSVIQDVNGDGYDDVVAGGWSYYVYCRNGRNGAQIWSYYVGSAEVVMRVEPIADINDDGIQDVLVGTWKNAIICLSGADGSLICEYTVGTLNGGDVWTVDPIDDVTGDGYPEALGGSFDYYTYCVDVKACTLLWKYYTGNRLYTVRGLPDVNGDGVPDAMAGTQMPTGGGGGIGYCISGGEPQGTAYAEPFLRVGNWLNPEPWHNWIGGPDDTSQIQLQIVDPDSQIQYVDFYYSIDGGNNWNFLQRDTNGYEPPLGITTPPGTSGDGWSAYLPHSILPIEIVSLQLKSIAHMGTESLEVRNQTSYDPTPPSSIVLNIHDWQAVSETLIIDVDPIRADIETIVFYIEEKADTFFKGIPGINQRPHSDNHCAPTAAAACLKYFEAQGDTHIAGGLDDDELVDALADRMGTDPNSGTEPSDWENGLRDWIEDHCHGYTVRASDEFDWKEARDELERCQDVLMGFYWDGGGGHAMTFNSIVNPPLPNGNIRVDFMDPWTGDYRWGEMDPNTGRLTGFNGAGASGNHGVTMIVCPKEPDPGGGGPGPPQGGGGGPNPPPIPIPLPFPGLWWVHAVVIDQSGNAHREIRVVCYPLRGDANGDDLLNSADVVYLINYLFIGGPAPLPCLEAGDANCDGLVNIADAVYLINYLFIGGPPPGC